MAYEKVTKRTIKNDVVFDGKYDDKPIKGIIMRVEILEKPMFEPILTMGTPRTAERYYGEMITANIKRMMMPNENNFARDFRLSRNFTIQMDGIEFIMSSVSNMFTNADYVVIEEALFVGRRLPKEKYQWEDL